MSAMLFVTGPCPEDSEGHWVDLDRDGVGDECHGGVRLTTLPEPGALVSLLAGASALATLSRRRRGDASLRSTRRRSRV